MAIASIAKGADRNAGRETFFVEGREPFRLPPHDPALYFVQRLRDEAHRFAIGTHRARRKKEFTKNPLDEIAGVGPSRKRALLLAFGSAKAVVGSRAFAISRRCPASTRRRRGSSMSISSASSAGRTPVNSALLTAAGDVAFFAGELMLQPFRLLLGHVRETLRHDHAVNAAVDRPQSLKGALRIPVGDPGFLRLP